MTQIKKQQGDVLLRKVDSIPTGSKYSEIAPKPRGFVLAEGETTGHAHCITELEDMDVYEVDGTMYIKCSTPKTVVHEEHGPITLEPGIWEVGIVQEYDPFSEEVQNVRD